MIVIMKGLKTLFLVVLALVVGFVMLTGCRGKMNADTMSGATKKSDGKMSMKAMGDKNQMGQMEKMQDAPNISMSEGTGYPVTITDKMGNTVTLEKKPEKIAAVSGTFLGLLYSVGGKSICTAEAGGGTPVPEEAVNDLPVIGKVYNLDVEKIIELQPELVIAQFGLQNGIIPALIQSKIPVLAFHMRNYEDVIAHLRVMGRITGEEQKAEEIAEKMEREKNAITEKLPEKSKTVVILYATSKDVSVKLPDSIAGNVAGILKLENIAAGCVPEGMGGETTPFSMEYIIEKDPDVILVTSMLSDDNLASEIICEKLGSDPVWKGLRAVKEENIVYLPQKYFLYNAGADFVEGIEYMAKGVYPEIYGELNE